MIFVGLHCLETINASFQVCAKVVSNLIFLHIWIEQLPFNLVKLNIWLPKGRVNSTEHKFNSINEMIVAEMEEVLKTAAPLENLVCVKQ